ncbi:hypothetical protein ARMGADRAFT_1035856 [Armillaria gallica]|uniref:Uncharacterized protein n=1 Tax=Armillaria gallica TaxID=47427 RepID=A0A2H3CWD1_ARMGA|nr:hypothetical protein ARMGADRAFT_1035856 [Armillaria gallica]
MSYTCLPRMTSPHWRAPRRDDTGLVRIREKEKNGFSAEEEQGLIEVNEGCPDDENSRSCPGDLETAVIFTVNIQGVAYIDIGEDGLARNLSTSNLIVNQLLSISCKDNVWAFREQGTAPAFSQCYPTSKSWMIDTAGLVKDRRWFDGYQLQQTMAHRISNTLQ